MIPHAPHPVHTTHPATRRQIVLRWLEAMLLLIGVALAMLGCQSGTAAGATVGKGAGAWWSSTISGDEGDIARGQSMGTALGGKLGAAMGVERDRQLRADPARGYSW